ncbi:hypothetical protein [Sediminibacillus dalangtanensis]|uniref:hypothetical protein n=1 Tax=Sediminibacillus dalangtanensis TaxID=2729421 RepID=UPI001AE0AFB8|nr:hypothetical protein [Sediminibacillus dalangtanensis]
MVDSFLDLMLGNFRLISSFYFQHQSLFNAIIVGGTVYQLFFRKSNPTRRQTRSEG